MIKKYNKEIGFIYKNNQNIDKVLNNGNLIFEQGFTRETSGVPPITLPTLSTGKNLRNYKIYGNSVQDGTPTPSNPVEIKSVGDNVTGLPLGYTQLEYIESTSTGTYGINTNILAIGKKIEIEAEYTGTTNDLNILLTYSQDYLGTFVGTYNKNWAISTSEVSSSSASQKTKLVVTFTSENNLNKVNMTVNNKTFEKTSGRANNYILLFGYKVGSTLTLSNKFIGKIYSCKIYNNNTNELVFNGIPCKNSSNVIGMYDTVNNVFYTNAGTGTFVAGNEVEKGGYKIPITVSDGTNSSTTNIYLDEPLRKIGDYADYIDYENQKVVRNIKEITLNGSENWAKYPSANTNSYYIAIPDSIKGFSTSLCNRFKNIPYGAWQSSISDGLYSDHSSLNYKYFKTPDNNTITTLEEFKNWLSIHNANLTYTLNTPTEESVTLPIIPSIKGTTIYSVGTNIQPSNMYIKYKGR